MEPKFSRWQKITHHPFIALTFAAYLLGWSGVGLNGGYPKITTTWITPWTTVASEQQPAKTLWDWLGLLAALAIPVVVGFGAAWFTA